MFIGAASLGLLGIKADAPLFAFQWFSRLRTQIAHGGVKHDFCPLCGICVGIAQDF